MTAWSKFLPSKRAVVAGLLAGLVFALLDAPLVTFYRVSGSSMQPAFEDGDRVLVTSVPAVSGGIDVGDTVIAEVAGETLIKRVLALPGETVWLEDGHVVRDGRGAGDFVPESMLDHCTSEAVLLGNDEYFLLGDNRRVSVDSRVFGALPRDAIIGKVLLRFQAGNGAMESAAAAKP
ncbi:MAG: signal peptidase I [Planctomycetes bacterium]|nr:signal peptidase I [Planctomycetota bacterium]MCC7169510.1 signal peptidase I [Planctomycetota bacterium]